MNKKTVLIFAYQKEAAAFISFYKMANLPFVAGKLFCSEDYFLLLTGEGIQKTTESISSFLALYENNISQMINLGIAASIDPQININQIYSIRTIYRELDGQMQFTSFSTNDEKASIDLVTSHTRVLDTKKAYYLNSFAPIVDRELWAIGSAAKLYKIPLYAYKIISDIQVKTDSDNPVNNKQENICQLIKENSDFFSAKLLDYFHKTHNLSSNDTRLKINNDFSVTSDSHFHFTISSTRNYQNLIEALKIKFNLTCEKAVLDKINIEDIISHHTNKKKRSAILIESLKNLLNPFQKKVKDKLNELTLPLQSSGGNIKFCENLETDQISINVKFENIIEFNKFKHELGRFPYELILKILNGESDV